MIESRVILLAALPILGCRDDETASSGNDGGTDDSGVATSSVDTEASNDGLPNACSAENSPFLQQECLNAIRVACSALLAENTCLAEPPFVFDGYVARCAWAKVVSFSDVLSCEVSSTVGRCEASIDTVCGNYCEGEAFGSNVAAIVSEGALIQMCNGPVGPWTALENPDVYGVPCGQADEAPGAVAQLCDCFDRVCDG